MWAGPASAQFNTQVGINTQMGTLLQEDIGASLFPGPGDEETAVYSYFTPRMSGLQLGVAYADRPTTPAPDIRRNPFTGLLDLGASYRKPVGALDLSISGRIGTAQYARQNRSDTGIWSTGVELGLRGVSVSGSYAEQRSAVTDNVIAYDATVSYRTGPWGFSFAYTKGNSRVEAVNSSGPEDRLEQYLLALNYSVAPGVDLGAYGGYVALNTTPDPGQVSNIDADVNGFVIGTGFRLEF